MIDGALPQPLERRSSALVLAGLHVRLGSIAIARTELEVLEHGGRLDHHGRLDLAEARWRAGDLTGAGEIAREALEEDPDAVIALVVAAEASAALGRPSEARRLASRALELTAGGIDAVFAGMPRAGVWPADPAEPVPSPATLFPTERVTIETSRTAIPVVDVTTDTSAPASVSATAGSESGPVGANQPPGFWDESSITPSAPPVPPIHATWLEAGRSAIEAGDPASAAMHLGLAMRLAPEAASGVLALVRGSVDPALVVVRGDALRALGYESEARETYAHAMSSAMAADERDRTTAPEPDETGGSGD